MSNAISKTLDEIFGGAEEIIGNHAPYAFDAEHRFVADAREAVEEALSMLPPAVKVALASKLKAATTIRDRTIKEEEAIWNEMYADPKPRGRGPNKARA